MSTEPNGAVAEAEIRGRGVPAPQVAIIGAGFAGLGMAIRLKRSGREDFVVFERGDSVGGTWRDNTYPGCACDVPSHLYSLSFAPNPDWSHSFSPQGEIWDYLRDVAEREGILPHIQFGCEVEDARWREDEARWELRTGVGEYRPRVLVSAIGGLIEPRMPDIPGLGEFPGEVFHSARWNHDFDLRGKRVAVIGTGASAIQFVPRVQPLASKLHLFQRTPAWIMPRFDRPIPRFNRLLYRRFPALQKLVRGAIFWSREALVLGLIKRPALLAPIQALARRHLSRQVRDPELRRKLTPAYTIGCKRILISNDFYPAVQEDNVELLTEGLAEVRGSTVIGADGSEREVDAIILGTGFRVTDFPGAAIVHGRDGRSLAEVWDGSPQAYRCSTVAGFPNLFVIGGPNIGIGHTSEVEMIEHQYPYVLGALTELERQGLEAVEVRPEAQRSFIAGLDRRMEGTVWITGGCSSWYLDRTGRNSTLWPDWTHRHERMLREFDLGAYETRPARAGAGKPQPPVPA